MEELRRRKNFTTGDSTLKDVVSVPADVGRYGMFLTVCLNQEALRLSDVSMEQILSTFAVYCVAVMQNTY